MSTTSSPPILRVNGLLDGKVVIVTGGSQGIGRGIVIGLVKEGASVVAHHLGTPETEVDILSLSRELEVIKPGLEWCNVSGDIALPTTSEKIVKIAVERFGRIDGLVSNAGICPFYSFLDIPHEVWERTRSVNLDGAFFIVQAVAKQMSNQSPPIAGYSIVAISSISALVGGGEQAHYTPTKAGVKSLMESCAISLAPFNIRCNSILPGTIKTAINAEDLSNPEKLAYMNKRIPLGRLGVPSDIAGPVCFLLSDMSSYVTGASILVDGGLFVNLQ